MTALTIRPYTASYKQEIIDLILSIQQNEFNIPVNIEEQPDLNDIPNFYQLKKGNFWIGTINNKVAGTIGLLDIENNQGALRKMFVKKAYRGKNYGVGQALLDVVFNYVKKNNFTQLYLGTIDKFIAAQRFYEKNGFVEIDQKNLPTAFPVMKVDTKFYRYTV